MTIEKVTRDNTYNNENDFSSEFTFSVFGSDMFDWFHDYENQYVGICEHMGGDVRGNYSSPRFFRVGDCLADSGFLDWSLSWHCESGPDQKTVDLINEECMAGYHASPTGHLDDILGTSDCQWIDGKAQVETDEGVYVLTPWYYGGDVGSEVVYAPQSGNWLYDASINTETWIESVLQAGDAEEITSAVLELSDYVHGSQPDWDDSEGVIETLRVYNAIDTIHGEGASKAIIEELGSDIPEGVNEEDRNEINELHRLLVRVIDNASCGTEFLDDVVYEFMTNAGV